MIICLCELASNVTCPGIARDSSWFAEMENSQPIFYLDTLATMRRSHGRTMARLSTVVFVSSHPHGCLKTTGQLMHMVVFFKEEKMGTAAYSEAKMNGVVKRGRKVAEKDRVERKLQDMEQKKKKSFNLSGFWSERSQHDPQMETAEQKEWKHRGKMDVQGGGCAE